jgi:PKD repeat protein
VYTVAGAYAVTLTVTDNDGGVATAQSTVTVSATPQNMPPTASLNLSVRSGEVPLAVEFSAEGSTDSDGTIVFYAWDFGDGASAGTSAASHTYTVAGVYAVTLTVTDNDGGVATVQSTVTCVISTPALPTVSSLPLHFEWDYDISLPGLAGYIFYQNDQHLLTINDPTTLTIDYAVEVEPGQSVVFTMKAFDINGNESAISSSYSLDVPDSIPPSNMLPTASLNLSTGSGEAPLAIEFSAESSTDSDGTIVAYAWDFGDGVFSAGNSTSSHTYTIAGVYAVTLTVTDNDGGVATAQSTVTVSVPSANIVPTALFYLTQASGTAPLDVGFNGAYSIDEDGTITSYLWNFGDGNSATGANVSHLYTTAGSFTAKLTVTDDNGAQAIYDRVIIVEAASVSPTSLVPTFTINPQVPTINEVVHFSGSVSTVPDGKIAYYLWDFGDGESANGVSVFHQYSVPGIYIAKLTVWDNYNASSQKSVALTVLSLESRAKELRINGSMDAIRFLLLKKREK